MIASFLALIFANVHLATYKRLQVGSLAPHFYYFMRIIANFACMRQGGH